MATEERWRRGVIVGVFVWRIDYPWRYPCKAIMKT